MLKIHFFPVGKGDSILIEFPDGDFAIVDCNKFQNKNSPVWWYLKYIKDTKGHPNIHFLHLTHPHLDHSKGIVELFEFCDWENSTYCFSPIDLNFQREYVTEQGEKDKKIQGKYCFDRGHFEDLAFRFFGLFSTRRIIHNIGSCFDLRGIRTERKSYYFLTPGDSERTGFYRQRYEPRATHIHSADRPCGLHQISTVLFIRHGKARVLLCGDTLAGGLLRAYEEFKRLAEYEIWNENDLPQFNAHLVKLSHHGSESNNTSTVIKTLCIPGKTKAIVTHRSGESFKKEYYKTAKLLEYLNIDYYVTGDIRHQIRTINRAMPQLEFARRSCCSPIPFRCLTWLTAEVDSDANVIVGSSVLEGNPDIFDGSLQYFYYR